MCNNFLADGRVSVQLPDAYRTCRSWEEETRGVSNIFRNSRLIVNLVAKWKKKQNEKQIFEYVLKVVYNKCRCM